MASANTLFKSHEDHRRQRELEEARKAGIAPAAVDEDGKEINPHIPQYMSSAPWYLNDSKPGLKHQKDWRSHANDSNKSYDRGVKVFQATKFRKGACDNCGSMSHKVKDCMERPRTKGAKWTNKHIAPDEKVEDVRLETYDAKRDRWAGYDAANYSRFIDMHEKVEAQKRELKKRQELERRFARQDGEASGSGEDSDLEDEDKITEAQDAGFAKVEKRVRTTAGGASGSVRNLRIREDTAKYLLNLDANSAHYDPKSRSMREDPQPNKDASQKAFAGDNFVRQSGDYHAWQALNLHSLAATQKGLDVHMQAAPSQAEVLHRQFRSKKEQLQVKNKDSIMATYGNAAEKVEDEALLLGQTEAYVEYDASGRVIKGVEAKARSRYEEDVHPGNHSSCWGSWWHDGSWGYACCHQTVKNSYCTGVGGEHAVQDASAQLAHNLDSHAGAAGGAASPDPASKQPAHGKGVWGSEVEADIQLDADKLAAAIAHQDKLEVPQDERKRPYNAAQQQEEVTAEDMEAWRLKRVRQDDPLQVIESRKKDDNGYSLV